MTDPESGSFRVNSNISFTSYPAIKPLNEDEFKRVHGFTTPQRTTILQMLENQVTCSSNTILHLFPILKWLPRYNLKENLVCDIVAGLTVAVMHIPQGLAYALLGAVPPIVGIYMAFFPVLIYILMGTSRHVSMGTFAVICLMVSKPVITWSSPSLLSSYNATGLDHATFDVQPQYTPIEVATAVCFIVGIWQVLLSLFKLGCMSVLLSETLVSGFTTGAAIHVLTSQIPNLLGLKLTRYNGSLKIIYTYIDLFKNISNSNMIAITISVCCIVPLTIFNEFVKPWVNKKFPQCKIPIPVELITIVVGTLLSQYLHFNAKYGVRVVGNVPTGIPEPTVPPLDLLPHLLVDGLVIAVVSVSINISMASIFARKLKYEIDSNQEILASGVGNVFGSFFSCMPYSVSLSRSLIQQTVGGKTQLASAVSCFLLLFVLLFIGPFFEQLPNCVLSSIIIVALKGMLFQIKDFYSYLKLSKLDGLVWMVAFLGVVILDIDIGLGLGLIASVLTMLLRSQTPEVYELGNIPGTDIFLDKSTYSDTSCTNSILMLKINGGLHFANCDQVNKLLLIKYSEFLQRSPLVITSSGKEDRNMFMVINMSGVPYVDPSAIKMLTTLFSELKKNHCRLFFCECLDSVYATLDRCNFFNHFPRSDIYPFLTDVLLYMNSIRNS